MASIRKTAENTADKLGLSFDKKRGVGFGVHRGYTMLVLPRHESDGKKHNSFISIVICASRDGKAPDKELFDAIPFGVSYSSGNFMQMFSTDVSYTLAGAEKILVNTANAAVTALFSSGYANCNIMGEEGPTDVYFFRDEYIFINSSDAEKMMSELGREKSEYNETAENIPLGIIGAAVCSLIGVAIILLLGRLGKVSLIGGLAMGGGIVWGYNAFGKKLSLAGAVICTVIAAAIGYLAFRIDIALDLFLGFKDTEYSDTFTFPLCFENAKAIYELGDYLFTYYMNMFLMLLCGAGGAVAVIWGKRWEITEQFSFGKLGK